MLPTSSGWFQREAGWRHNQKDPNFDASCVFFQQIKNMSLVFTFYKTVVNYYGCSCTNTVPK